MSPSASPGFRAVLAIFFAAAVFAADPSPRSWRVKESRLLTETRLEQPGNQQFPVAAAVPEGFCVAWRDLRQGGAILAARVDRGGRVLDPAGLPVTANSSSIPNAVLSSPAGCVVVYSDGYGTAAVLIPNGADPDPRPHFTLPNLSWPMWSGADRMVFQKYVPDGGRRLVLVDADGRTIAESPVEAIPVAVGALDEGFVVVTQRYANGQWELDLWRGGADLQLERISSWTSPQFHGARVAAAEEILVVADTSEPTATRAELRRFTLAGKPLGAFTINLPLGSTLRDLRRRGGGYHAEWSIHRNLLVVRFDGYSVVESYQVPDTLFRTFAADGGVSLQVWASWGDGLYYALGEAEPEEGAPLTLAPAPEVIVDGDVDGESVALLWYERDAVAGLDRFHVALTTLSEPRLDVRAAVFDESGDSWWRGGAVAVRKDVALVAWSDEGSLRYRRISGSGSWIDPSPVALSDVSPPTFRLFEKYGLVASAGGFAIVWSEIAGESDFTLKGAVIDDAGIVQRYDLRTEPSDRPPIAATLVPLDGGYAVAWIEPGPPCYISPCPVPRAPVHVGLYDASFNFVGDITPDGASAITTPQLVLGGESLLLFLGSSAFVYGRNAEGAWQPREEILSELGSDVALAGAGIVWTGSDFLIALQRFNIQARSSSTVGARIAPGVPDATLFTLVEDWSDLTFDLAYVPQLFVTGGSVLLIGSEVSADPDEGFVRRLRLHVLEPSSPRGRMVRRR